jgi:AcrR family transcriptional regulator
VTTNRAVEVATNKADEVASGRVHRTRPEHGEQTRAALLEAARELFASEGYAAVALQQVCDRAGVTRGALYHHFAGKDELFCAVCEEVADDVSRRVLELVAPEPDPWSRLRVGCLSFLDVCADPAVRQILLSDAPSVLGWEAFREIDARHGLGLLKAALRAAIDAGAIEPAPVDALAHLLVGALNEAAMVVARAPAPDRARREAAEGVERMLAGIAGSRQPPGVAG